MLFLPSLPLAFEFTSPGPTIVQLGSFSMRWYGLLIASAVVIGTLLSQWMAKRRNLDPEIVSDLVIWLVVGAIPGARAYYVAFEWQRFQSQPWYKIFAIWEGGIAIHGAIIGGTIAAILFARRNRLSVWQLADLVAPSLILGQAIGRWGNFFNSEAFGRPTNLPWKLFIPVEKRPPEFSAESYFHPTFLYESLWNVGVFGILMMVFQRFPRAKKGTIAALYLIFYSIGRFWIEGLRTDSLMFLSALRIAQIVSLAAIAGGILVLWWLYGWRGNLPDTIPQEELSPAHRE